MSCRLRLFASLSSVRAQLPRCTMQSTSGLRVGTPACLAGFHTTMRTLAATKSQGHSLMRFPRNTDIKAPYATIVELDGKLREGGPHSTKDVLRQLDIDRYFLVEVQSDADPPVCRIVDKKHIFEQQKAVKERKKVQQHNNITKQIIISDAVQAFDLGHKTKRVRQMLEKGFRVTLTVESRVVPAPGRERVEAEKRRRSVLDEMMRQLRDVSSVTRPVSGDHRTMHVMLQGKPRDDSKTAKDS